MTDVFISYARSTEAQARRITEALNALGYAVWNDEYLPAHRAYAEVIEERLNAAKAVVVIWSPDAAKSEWVRSEANRARESHKLVQIAFERLVSLPGEIHHHDAWLLMTAANRYKNLNAAVFTGR